MSRRPTTATIARAYRCGRGAGRPSPLHISAVSDARKFLRAAGECGRRFRPPKTISSCSVPGEANTISLNLFVFLVFSAVHRISVKKLSFGAGHRRTRCYNPARFRGKHKRPDGSARDRCPKRQDARIAQLVEQRIENPRVGGSNPPPGTIFLLEDLVSMALEASMTRCVQEIFKEARDCFRTRDDRERWNAFIVTPFPKPAWKRIS